MFKYLFLILLLSFNSFAQDSEPGTDEADTSSNYFFFDYIESLTAGDYELYVDSIKQGLSEDYFSLRMAFTKTEKYSPYDIEISKKHNRAEAAIDEGNLDLALSVTDSILAENYVDIYTHLLRGYIYEQLGDTVKAAFYYKVYNGLLESIYYSGNGETPETAYIVITTKEEYAFLKWFSLQFKEQQLIYKDKYAFDLMSTVENETGEEHDIYFNITIAVNVLERTMGK